MSELEWRRNYLYNYVVTRAMIVEMLDNSDLLCVNFVTVMMLPCTTKVISIVIVHLKTIIVPECLE